MNIGSEAAPSVSGIMNGTAESVPEDLALGLEAQKLAPGSLVLAQEALK